MNKQMFLKLMLMTTSKYILSRLLKTVDNKLFYQDYDKTSEVLYSCLSCNYFTSKSLLYIDNNKCPCCSNKKLDIFSSESVNIKNTTTISKILNNIYIEVFNV